MRFGVSASDIRGGLTLLESIGRASVPDWVCDELARYNATAGRKLDPRVAGPLAAYLPTGPTVLYRGLGFEPSEGAAFLKKLKAKPSEGASGVYKTGKIQSWTTNAKEAENFAGKHSIAGRIAGSLGIVLRAKFDPTDVMVAVELLPPEVKKKCIHFDQNEWLMKPGSYPVEIVKLVGDWKAASSAGDPSKVIKAAASRALEATGGSGIKKTWNGAPGFAIFYQDLEQDGYVPSLEVAVRADGEVSIGLMASLVKSFPSIVEQMAYLASDDFIRDFKTAFQAVKRKSMKGTA